MGRGSPGKVNTEGVHALNLCTGSSAFLHWRLDGELVFAPFSIYLSITSYTC